MPAHTSGKKSYPLHITISTLFIFLVVVFGTILGVYNYKKTSDILLTSSDRIFDHSSSELSLNLLALRRPVAQAVSMLASSGIVRAGNLEERIPYLNIIQAALITTEELSALQVGYDDGDYFIARSLDNEYMRERFSAPEGATLVVDNIQTGNDGRRYLQRLWYSAERVELGRAEPQLSEYDPRVRPWYMGTMKHDSVVSIAPYLFFFTQKVGFNIGRKNADGSAVVAGDITLAALSDRIASLQHTPNSEFVVLHDTGKVVAYKDPSLLVVRQDTKSFELASIKDLGSGLLSYVSDSFEVSDSVKEFSYDGKKWIGGVRALATSASSAKDKYFLLFVAPKDELLAEAVIIQKRAIQISIILVLITIPITWVLARFISTPLRLLSTEAGKINRFDFTGNIGDRSKIKEVSDLAGAMAMMKETIGQFLTLITSLASEQKFDATLKLITTEALRVAGASTAVTYLLNDDGQLVPEVFLDSSNMSKDPGSLPSYDSTTESLFTRALLQGEPQVVTPGESGGESLEDFEQIIEGRVSRMVVFPLQNRQKEGIGLLCLCYADGESEVSEEKDKRAFLKTFSDLAAVNLEGRKLLEMQKALLESFVKLLAGAIDSKSPYTGGHCQRVPVITKLLARKACDQSDGAFKDFNLSEEEWEALHIASWLHDCGKVTTPEYVVDKATKLETLYDRIHEVRMRFEVLRRDAEVRLWKSVAEGEDREELQQNFEKECQELQDDFVCIAECNIGGEYMDPSAIERVEKIGSKTWMRYFSDRIGISWEEMQRKDRSEAQSLPVMEQLLSDREDHLIERSAKYDIAPDNPYGFVLDVPEHLYNRGELYNLKVTRGTLSGEERYRINDHIVQTIIMLKHLPYPKHLRDVPEIAGGHHEKIDGTGYPRCLKGEEMLPQAKMMVIADIFEALTASDRPYKKAKTLSEAIRILGFMEKDNHIDKDLFELFLTSGLYMEYAKEYLNPEQIDEVDISSYLHS